MTTILIPFTVLWTLCTSVRARHDDYYFYNTTRVPVSGIAAYRSALTLDWLAAEDTRQREMVAAIEADPTPFPAISMAHHSDCISYARPSSGSVARLMLELLKNLEGDDGVLLPNLMKALVRAKLLVLETSMFENEPDLDALVKTPAAMIGEPHTTFPRILATVWMAVTDPSTVKKHGWCTVKKMTTFLLASRPIDIAKHMRAVEPVIARARFIMEEFIQHVTPLNMVQKRTDRTSPRPVPNDEGRTLPLPLRTKRVFLHKQVARGPDFEPSLKVKRPLRTYPVMARLNSVTLTRIPPSPTWVQDPTGDEVDPESANYTFQILPREFLTRAASTVAKPPVSYIFAVCWFLV